jgi:hypothetical protein
MSPWRWFVSLLKGSQNSTSVPDDVRYYEAQHRIEIDTAAADAARVVDSRINSGSHPAAP